MAAVRAGGAAKQVADNIGITAIQKDAADPIPQLLAGINEILEQGEGASCGSLFAGTGSEDESSHYVRFAEIYYGAGNRDPVPNAHLPPQTQQHFSTAPATPAPLL